MSDTGTSDLAGPSEEIACILGESKRKTRSDGWPGIGETSVRDVMGND